MPYKSDAQRRFFHTDTAKKAGITSSEVHEFDEASKSMKLPEYKAEGGDIEDADSKELMDSCAQECLDAIGRKDLKLFTESIKALILDCLDKDK